MYFWYNTVNVSSQKYGLICNLRVLSLRATRESTDMIRSNTDKYAILRNTQITRQVHGLNYDYISCSLQGKDIVLRGGFPV